MNYTTDEKIFFDSNILIYLLDQDLEKKRKTGSLLVNERSFISSQIVNENINICLKKLNLTDEESFKHGKFLLEKFNLILIDKEVIYMAFHIKVRYKYNYWDCLIISSALSCEATVLYSEDMQHNQLIEGKLRIINPFKM